MKKGTFFNGLTRLSKIILALHQSKIEEQLYFTFLPTKK